MQCCWSPSPARVHPTARAPKRRPAYARAQARHGDAGVAGGLAAQQQLLRMQAGLSPTHMALADMAAMQSGGGLGGGVPSGLGAMGLLGPQARACALAAPSAVAAAWRLLTYTG